MDTLSYIIADSLKFKRFAEAPVNALMPNDSTLTIAAQTVNCKKNFTDAPVALAFSGSGSLSYARSGPSIKTTITINYTQVKNGVTIIGTTTYKN